ncbi:hypothetical protein ABB34_13255 [Stenotrophomonas daejeonensis]|uniref:General secretion pathway protein GspI n=1 Tax=Stenotrophomonas daejeonensis TaxID=659018 RepID=A0A0R0DM06_9GAMM|nr:prepilin-type N-terminal cleavage/methylation domain-containing protein [Stenotrophomonas daejeonensis]KRG82991.1 hypothetical protein ABB34_13255 [Stenotrophomonas daejeonensis]
MHGRRRASSSSRLARRPSGFTLIEVVVAFALLAGALTLLVGALSNAGRQVREADEVGRATLHAQSLLAQIGVGERLKPGTRQGEFEDGRFRWVLQITPYHDPARGKAATPEPMAAATRLLELDLDVRWGDGPRQHLRQRTLRLVRADAGGRP